MQMLKAVILYLWQLPQNIVGLIVILLFNGKREKDYYKPTLQFRFYSTQGNFGISLGMYVIMHKCYYNYTTNAPVGIKLGIKHEHGHQIQSLYLGPLYLLLIGIPSLLGNRFDYYFHKNWSWQERQKWYYSQIWEHWADKLGGVERNL